MGLLRNVERRLQDLIEGGLARVFGQRVAREVVLRAVGDAVDLRGIDGRRLATNAFTVRLNPDDHAALAADLQALAKAGRERVQQVVREQGWTPAGAVQVRLVAEPAVPRGEVRVEAECDDSPVAAVLEPQTGGRPLVLRLPRHVVGRRPPSDLLIDELDVSGEHAALSAAEGRWTVEDLGSTNGTFVNGARVLKVVLRDGDLVQFGPAAYRYREG